MNSRIDKRNAVSVYLYTSLMGPWDLHLTAQEFILQHFEQVTVLSSLRKYKVIGMQLEN